MTMTFSTRFSEVWPRIHFHSNWLLWCEYLSSPYCRSRSSFSFIICLNARFPSIRVSLSFTCSSGLFTTLWAFSLRMRRHFSSSFTSSFGIHPILFFFDFDFHGSFTIRFFFNISFKSWMNSVALNLNSDSDFDFDSDSDSDSDSTCIDESFVSWEWFMKHSPWVSLLGHSSTLSSHTDNSSNTLYRFTMNLLFSLCILLIMRVAYNALWSESGSSLHSYMVALLQVRLEPW